MDDANSRNISILLNVLLMIFLFVAGMNQSRMNSLVDECEKTLPRDEQCVLIAVPESEAQQNDS